MSSATALPLKGTAQISHARMNTKGTSHILLTTVVQKKQTGKKRRERESKENAHNRDRKRGEVLPPTQCPFPPPSTHCHCFSLPLVINLPALPALLSVLPFWAHANFSHTHFHFLALFQNAWLILILHSVGLGNKLAAPTPYNGCLADMSNTLLTRLHYRK